MRGQREHQSEARSDLDAEVRLLHSKLKRALMFARHDRVALVQSAATGNYRFVDSPRPDVQGLLGWCDRDTTLEQLRTYMVGDLHPVAVRESARSTG